MQSIIPTLHSVRRGVGDALTIAFPANTVALGLHQRDKFSFGRGVFHALVNGVDESELPAFAFERCVVLCVGYGFDFFLSLRLKDRQAELHADFIITLTQFVQLFIADVQLLPILQLHRVDDEM